MSMTQDSVPESRPELHAPTMALLVISLCLKAAILVGILLLALQPDARDWMASRVHLTTTDETEAIAGASSGGLADLNYSLADLASATDELNTRLGQFEADVDDISLEVDDLTEFEHHVCGWARDEATSWIGSDLYWTFAALRSPFRCPTF